MKIKEVREMSIADLKDRIAAEKANLDSLRVNHAISPLEDTSSANFTNDLGADSLDTVELLMEFERVFGIKIPDEDAASIATVADAVNYVESKLEK